MNKFSIKEVEAYTGIKAHTIRIWEQRYKIVEPKRTATNIRYYDSRDLKTLLNISFLNQNGYKISKLASLSEEEIAKLVRSKDKHNRGDCSFSDSLKMGMLSFDKKVVENAIDDYQSQHGWEKTMEELVFPFVCQIGTLWQTGMIDPCHEHFMTTVVKNRLISAISDVEHSVKPYRKEKFLLILPDGEWHELSLQYLNYKLVSKGFEVIFLGQSVPLLNLANAIKRIQPNYVVMAITSAAVAQEVVDKIDLVKQEITEFNTQFLIANSAEDEFSLSEIGDSFKEMGTLYSFVEEKLK
ncbi:MerR family transcriptional regulator [Luteibaculum oceani]|uniref:MerR family transcriptional regulator n=1 Tax=Luteibaculum oceani TaxID=1294296 RepID=A0A5C6V132_9FLAO|nr:MerR family transcriptional regulator [Luteibaculum oceani]TXC76988.1 MerR family transcriptional regulator [Luteibaculum oceani]